MLLRKSWWIHKQIAIGFNDMHNISIAMVVIETQLVISQQ